MKRFGEVLKTAESEGREKHVPVIGAPARVKAGEPFAVKVTVGAEVAHPNTVEHHIKWIQLFAAPEGRPPVHVATVDLGPTLGVPTTEVTVRLERSAVLFALAYCNLHGVWESSAPVAVE